jgi:hypothetical protein
VATWILLASGISMPAFRVEAEDPWLGAYLVRGSARVQVSPFPTEDYPGEMRVTIDSTRTPGRVSVRVESQGHSCTLGASRSGKGVLAFSTPATCVVEVREPDARGRVDARLRSGSGTLRDGRLTLELLFDVGGHVATRIPRTRFKLLNAEITVPESWTPSVQVGGIVTSSGSGPRQGS